MTLHVVMLTATASRADKDRSPHAFAEIPCPHNARRIRDRRADTDRFRWVLAPRLARRPTRFLVHRCVRHPVGAASARPCGAIKGLWLVAVEALSHWRGLPNGGNVDTVTTFGRTLTMKPRHFAWYALAVAAVAIAAIALGVKVSTVLLLAVVLACPVMMMFMMGGGHGHGSTHDSTQTHEDHDHRDSAGRS